MVGFKTFWITLSLLFMVGACVPQAKQTACKGNEAYNASLRKCVPTTVNEDQAMTFSSYLPLAPINVHKFAPSLNISVMVSNPFTRPYKIEWDRTFNGVNYFISVSPSTTDASKQFVTTVSPPSLSAQIGQHVYRASIKNANNDTVAVKTFEVYIQNDGTPTIYSPSVEPIDYNVAVTPVDAPVLFKLEANPNGATDGQVLSAGYRLTWKAFKNSIEIGSLTETQLFSAATRIGTHYYFQKFIDPSDVNLGTGNITVRATITNSSSTVIAQQVWSMAINHPQMGQITSVNLPAPAVTTIAYNNLDYTQYPAYNFLYPAATRGRYCVDISQPYGTYSGDGQGLYVRYYLNGVGTHIYEQETQDNVLISSETICLIGGTSTFTQALLKFNNSSSNIEQAHKISVRVFDRRTSTEFGAINMAPSMGSYPVEWPVLVKPTNSAPIIAFGSTKPATCTSNGSFAQDNCSVIQGTPFTVGFTVSDDFYNAAVADAVNAGKFKWDVKLKLGGTDVTGASCSKAFGDTTATTSGEYLCTLTVPHYTTAGPLSPVGPFSIVATLQDQDSPVDPVGKAALPITWNLNVTEDNSVLPNIAIAPQQFLDTTTNISLSTGAVFIPQDPNDALAYVTEGDTLAFFLSVTDPERDNFRHQISLCKDNTPACTNSSLIPSPGTHTRTDATNPVLVNALLYQIPEDLLLQLIPMADVDKTTGVKVYFKAEVFDIPSMLITPVRTHSEILSVYVRNFNPAPIIDTATAVPALGTTGLSVMAGYPFTINPGTVTDPSLPSTEKVIQYQWYSKLSASATWTAITGATERILRWTPDTGATGNIDLKLCVGDRPAANPISPSAPAPQCSGVWTVTPKNYLNSLSGTGMTGDTSNEMSVWHDTTNPSVIYSAYVGSDLNIYVEKTVTNATGDFNTTSFQTVSFPAINPSTATSSVTNLSITGSGNSLYVVYQAAPVSSPTSSNLRIRRINTSFGPTGTKSAMPHGGKFGFSYPTPTQNYALACTPASSCTNTFSNGAGSFTTIAIDVPLLEDETINVNGYTFIAKDAPNPSNPQEFLSAGSGATVAGQATSISSKINASIDPRLQGFTATVSSSTVTIYGNEASDFLDFTGSIPSVPAIAILDKGVGKVFVTGGKVFIPFVNSNAPGPIQNNLSFITGNVDVHLRDPAFNLVTNGTVPGLGKIASFDSQLSSSGELVVAYISAESSTPARVKLSRLLNSGGIWGISTSPTTQLIDIFPTLTAERVKVAANKTGNDSIFVMIKEPAISGGEYHIGKYTNILTTPFEAQLEGTLVTTDDTSTVISNTLMKNPEIVSVPNSSEARIFFQSVGTPVGPETTRIARWRSDNTISCGACAPITSEVLAGTNIGVSNLVPNITFGSIGSVANENQKDVFFMVTSALEPISGNYKASLSVINGKVEPINATAVDTTDHLFRPPFIKD